MNYMFMPLRRYFDFSGRSRRLEFWLWALFLNIVGLAFFIWISGPFFEVINSLAERAANGEFAGYSAEGEALTASVNGFDVPFDVFWPAISEAIGTQLTVWSLWGLFVFIPNLAVAVRRLHDTDRSGWSLLFGLIPLIGAIILLVFFLSRGTPGPNRYGPDPKAVTAGPQFN